MAHDPLQKARTRRRILLSARTLFAEHGYRQTSIDTIMTHCGLTRGAFYHHFESKAALYQLACASLPQVSELTLLSTKAATSTFSSPEALTTLINGVGVCEPQLASTYSQLFQQATATVIQQRHLKPHQHPQAAALVALLTGAGVLGRACGAEIQTALNGATETAIQTLSDPPQREEYLWEAV